MNAISFFHPRIQHSGSVVVSKEKKTPASALFHIISSIQTKRDRFL